MERTRVVGGPVRPKAWLVVMNGLREGQIYKLGRDTTIGRSNTNSLCLPDDSVSAEHVKIKRELGGRYVLYDLASLNRTIVNGHLIQKQLLVDDDRITLGETNLVFKEVR